jgi:hypothetical protein
VCVCVCMDVCVRVTSERSPEKSDDFLIAELPDDARLQLIHSLLLLLTGSTRVEWKWTVKH